MEFLYSFHIFLFAYIEQSSVYLKVIYAHVLRVELCHRPKKLMSSHLQYLRM